MASNEGAKLLFVDDDERVARMIRRSFEGSPYKCVYASGGLQAKEILQREKVDVIISDIKMPEMEGPELLGFVAKEYPDVVRIAMSGTFDISDTIAAINQGHVSNYILKPFSSARLKIMIYRELKSRDESSKARERELARQRNAAQRAREAGRSFRELKSFVDDIYEGLVESLLATCALEGDKKKRFRFKQSLIARVLQHMKHSDRDRVQMELAALFHSLPNSCVVDIYNRHTSSDVVRRGIYLAKKNTPEVLLVAEEITRMAFDEKVPWIITISRINQAAAAKNDVDPELLLAINEIEEPGTK